MEPIVNNKKVQRFTAATDRNRTNRAVRLVFPRRWRRGEGGIRTLGSLLGYGALAKRCFQPLSHLTKIFYDNTLQLFFAAKNWEL